MHLSSLLVDLGDNPDRPRPGRLWLRNRYRVHQRLCMAFPSLAAKADDPAFLKPYSPGSFTHVHGPRSELQAFLFRVDPQPGNRALILVQSATRPDWEYAFQNAGYLLAAPPQVQPYDPLFEAGQAWRFRLLANPTKRLREASLGPDGKLINPELWKNLKGKGKRVPVPRGMLQDWLMRRAGDAGFRVVRLYNVQPGYLYVAKNGEGTGTRLRSAQYDGILEVTDPQSFRHAFIHGIGPGKAFGFGLVSVRPIPGG